MPLSKEEVMNQKARVFADFAAPYLNENDEFNNLIDKMQNYIGDSAIIANEKKDHYALITKSDILRVIGKYDNKNIKIKDIIEFKEKNNIDMANSANESDPLSEVIRKLKKASLKPIPLLDSKKAIIGTITQSSISSGLDAVLNI